MVLRSRQLWLPSIFLTFVCALVCTAAADAHSDKKEHQHNKKDSKTDQQSQPVTKSEDSDSVPCLSWISTTMKPKALLLCIHGLGLYSGSYTNFGKHLSRLGINVYAIDVRGFGSWMRNGGHEQVDFDGCLKDVKTTLLSIRTANPGLPMFLMGESMGGAIALRATSMYPDLISGLISSVPSGDRFKQKKTNLKVAMQFLKGANKQFNVGSAIVDQATTNPKLRKDWADNPLDRMDLSPKELIQFQSFMNDNHDSAKKITTVPVLMVEGNNDKLVKPEGTWELFNDIECEQKSFLAVPSEHLIFEEQQDKERIYDRRIDSLAAAWILCHMEDPLATRVATKIHNYNLSGAINFISSGNYTEAQTALQKILEREPFNGEAHYWLGVALYKSANVTTAQREFATCISLGNDQVHLKDANNYLMAMKGKDFSLPAITAGDPESGNAPINRSDITGGTPTVLAFYAPWAEQCKDVAPMFDQAHARFGDRLKLLQINIDDQNSKNLVSQFNIGPIPTFVFLTAEGNVAKTRIGMSSFLDFAKNITTIMPR